MNSFANINFHFFNDLTRKMEYLSPFDILQSYNKQIHSGRTHTNGRLSNKSSSQRHWITHDSWHRNSSTAALYNFIFYMYEKPCNHACSLHVAQKKCK